MVGAAVPYRPPHPQPNGRGGSPCRPPRPQPNGRGGSPCRPRRPQTAKRSILKTCSPVFLSGTCGASRRSVSVAFCCSSEFLLHVLLISTAIPVRAAGTAAPTVGGGSRSPPSLYIFYIFYTVNPLPPPLSAFSASLREIFYFTRRDVKISTLERAYSRFYVKIRKKQPSGMLI